MKKLICLLGHNKSLMNVRDCNKESFENENRKITVYTCKYCKEDVLVITNSVKGKLDLSKAFTKDINITKGNCDYCLEECGYQGEKQYKDLYYIHIGKKEINLCKECLLKLQESINEFVKDKQIESEE